MTVNLHEIRIQISALSEQILQREAIFHQRRELAQQLLINYAKNIDLLRQRVERAEKNNNLLRCAVPVSEPLDAAFHVPDANQPRVLIAADGSQINPSRHDAIEFGLVNVGAIRWFPGAGKKPETITQSKLYYSDLLAVPPIRIDEELIALQRDLRERQLLVEEAKGQTLPIIALTDGPLEFFHQPHKDQIFNQVFEEYLAALDQLAELDVTTAGYVDKPRADLLAQLLELTIIDDEALISAGRNVRPLSGVTDTALLDGVIKSGERSAVFALQSSSAQHFKKYNERLALHFFYLNVGFKNEDCLVRVEIPAWVADNIAALNSLHLTLVDQCRKLGTKPYPYVLHRAHEIALVKLEEKEHLTQMIDVEMRRRGVTVLKKSNKQANKDVTGKRTRYEA